MFHSDWTAFPPNNILTMQFLYLLCIETGSLVYQCMKLLPNCWPYHSHNSLFLNSQPKSEENRPVGIHSIHWTTEWCILILPRGLNCAQTLLWYVATFLSLYLFTIVCENYYARRGCMLILKKKEHKTMNFDVFVYKSSKFTKFKLIR